MISPRSLTIVRQIPYASSSQMQAACAVNSSPQVLWAPRACGGLKIRASFCEMQTITPEVLMPSRRFATACGVAHVRLPESELMGIIEMMGALSSR